MKNHFIFSYTGNKRNEAEDFLNLIDAENVVNIIEPFCGSSAISYNIWKKYGDKFNYYLNDNDAKLYELYNLYKNETIENIINNVNNVISSIKSKEDWKELLKSDHDIYAFIYFKKYSSMGRYGFSSLTFFDKNHTFKINEEAMGFINFIKQPYVHISNDDWFNIFDKYKNDEKSIYIFDPPYINSCNDFYISKNLNVYQYFYDNKIEIFKCKTYLILEDNWIIRLLFMNNNIINSYAKKYELSKKQTTHIVIAK